MNTHTALGPVCTLPQQSAIVLFILGYIALRPLLSVITSVCH